MKDFDAETRTAREDRDRTFRIGGRELRYRPGVAPESILRWSQARAGETTPDEAEWLTIFDETILAMLEPGQDEAWLQLREPTAKHPLTIEDLSALLSWLFEQVTGRPTGPESGSSPGSGSTETGSRDVASSPVEAPSAG